MSKPPKSHFLYIEEETLYSDAWLGVRAENKLNPAEQQIEAHVIWKITPLPGAAVKLYCALRMIAYGHLATSCLKDIRVGYDTLAKRHTGLSEQAVRNNMIILENRGFIDFIFKGGLKSKKETSNLYRLSKRFQKYGQDNFKHGPLTMMHVRQKQPRPACGFIKLQPKKKAAECK